MIYLVTRRPAEISNTDIIILSVQSLNEFQTTYMDDLHTERLLIGKLKHNFDQQYFYPFDEFNLETNLIAMSPDENTTSLNITALGFSDYVSGFVPIFHAVQSRTSINGTMVNSHFGQLTISRNNTARTFVMIIFIVNWAFTGMVVYITVISSISKKENWRRNRSLACDGHPYATSTASIFCGKSPVW